MGCRRCVCNKIHKWLCFSFYIPSTVCVCVCVCVYVCVPIIIYSSLDVCFCLFFQQVEAYQQLSSDISWFFFDLFVMGYVEDESTGLSFSVPPGKKWSVYVEVSHIETGPARCFLASKFLDGSYCTIYYGQ